MPRLQSAWHSEVEEQIYCNTLPTLLKLIINMITVSQYLALSVAHLAYNEQSAIYGLYLQERHGKTQGLNKVGK